MLDKRVGNIYCFLLQGSMRKWTRRSFCL